MAHGAATLSGVAYRPGNGGQRAITRGSASGSDGEVLQARNSVQESVRAQRTTPQVVHRGGFLVRSQRLLLRPPSTGGEHGREVFGMVYVLSSHRFCWHQYRSIDTAASSKPSSGEQHGRQTRPLRQTSNRLRAPRSRPRFPCSGADNVVAHPGISLRVRRPQGNDRAAPVFLSTVGGSLARASSPHSRADEARPEEAQGRSGAEAQETCQDGVLLGRKQFEKPFVPIVHTTRSTTPPSRCHFSLRRNNVIKRGTGSLPYRHLWQAASLNVHPGVE